MTHKSLSALQQEILEEVESELGMVGMINYFNEHGSYPPGTIIVEPLPGFVPSTAEELRAETWWVFKSLVEWAERSGLRDHPLVIVLRAEAKKYEPIPKK